MLLLLLLRVVIASCYVLRSNYVESSGQKHFSNFLLCKLQYHNSISLKGIWCINMLLVLSGEKEPLNSDGSGPELRQRSTLGLKRLIVTMKITIKMVLAASKTRTKRK